MSKKISTLEPAERPFTVALSKAEILALANYHVSQAKRITKKVGTAVLNPKALFAGTSSSSIIKVGKEMMNAHLARAKGLQSILDSKS